MKRIYKKLTESYISKITKTIVWGLLFNTLNVQAQVLVPPTGSNSIACGTSTLLLDPGGNNNYANSQDGYTVLYAGAGGIITIQGTYTTEQNYDFITMYDGVGIGGTQLSQVSGQNGVTSFTGNPGQTLTIRFRSDGSQVYSGFSYTITYSGQCLYPSCLGAPAANSVVATSTLVCPVFGVSSLSLANVYSLSAISYSFQMSTGGAFGPYTNIPNATGTLSSNNTIAYTTPTLNTTTWYQVVMTCTNGGSNTTAVPIQIQVAGTTTNTVPYFEGFEGITQNNQLPNCSWTRSDNFQCSSRTGSVSAWRTARTGTKFAEFDASNNVYNQTRYFYTNGILMNAGITYSAALWYATNGSSTWNNLTILVGPNQTPGGLALITTAANTNSQAYQLLSNTFQVPTTGMYYVAVRAQEQFWGSQLVWDDLSITAPCQFTNNAANITFAGSTSVCAGQSVAITASGAATYTWAIGPNTNTIGVSPAFNTVYSVTGLNPFSGCLGTNSRTIEVMQLPPVSIVASKMSVCDGEPVDLQALSAVSYSWSTGSVNTPVITVTPGMANSSYTVRGSNTFGCIGEASFSIAVNPIPTVGATGNTLICLGYPATLNGAGAAIYEWTTPTAYLKANPVMVSPTVTTTYSITGTSTANCKGNGFVTVVVDPCTGIENVNANVSKVFVYPNPNTGVFTVSLNNGLAKTIEVVDITGRVVLTNTTISNITDVNISALANGVYYVKVRSENISEVIKVVKQ